MADFGNGAGSFRPERAAHGCPAAGLVRPVRPPEAAHDGATGWFAQEPEPTPPRSFSEAPRLLLFGTIAAAATADVADRTATEGA